MCASSHCPPGVVVLPDMVPIGNGGAVAETWDWIAGAMAGMTPASYLALVVVLGVVAQIVAWRIKLPSILLLLVIGFGLGQLVSPEEVLGRAVLFGGVNIAVGVILFEGALSMKWRQVRDLGKPVWRLCSVVVMITWGLISAAAALVGFEPEVALLRSAAHTSELQSLMRISFAVF